MATQQTINDNITGLWLNPSTFSQAPQGACSQVDNVVIDRDSRATTRRGFFRYGDTFGTTTVTNVLEYNGTLIIHGADGILYYDSDNNGTWVAYTGTYLAPTTDAGSQIRSLEENKNFYFATRQGIFKLDSITTNPRLAGAPPGLSGSGTTTGSTGFMTNGVNIAYQIVWGYRDLNNNLILGAPSQRIIVGNNTGHTANVSLTFQIPDGIDTTWFYQVYRSPESQSLADPPSEELYQTYENNPTSGQITASQVTITDITPSDLLQTTLYTSPSQEGIQASNYRPPFAKDTAQYRNYTFYANTRSPHRLYETLLAAGALEPQGIQIGSTITFTNTTNSATFTITGASSEVPSTGHFAVSNTGDPAVDIEATAQSIVSVINQYNTNDFIYAYYLSGFNDLPGQILFEKIDISPEYFYVNCSSSTCFQPRVFPTGTSAFSTNEVAINRLYFSKVLQPEAVPLANFFNVGSANQPIDRIITLRDGLMIFKQEGIYYLNGTDSSNFIITLLENKKRIIAANSPAVLDNQVYFLSDEGVIAASPNGTNIMSRPIEQTLLQLTSPTLFPNFSEICFGVAYNEDKKYILALQTTSTDTSATQQYVYNYITRTWTRWTRDMTCAIVRSTDRKLYHGGPDISPYGSYVFKERKNYNSSDYADEQYNINITGSSGLTLTLATTASVTAKMTITQDSSGAHAIVTAVLNSTTITVDVIQTWDVGVAVAYTPILSVISPIQQDCKNPGLMKHFREIDFLFMTTEFNEIKATWYNDINSVPHDTTIFPKSGVGWGEFVWGGIAWGGLIATQQRLRGEVPWQVARGNWLLVTLTNQQAFTSFDYAGMSIIYTTQSERKGPGVG